MIIVDFIDMISRADKLAMLEELEIALEPDKAKPQVGQISDLGLVELTRHRQGQSLSEIFTKKCPHCQGTGYFMNEFNFASPTAEGEYRAKNAKMKLPVNKKNNRNNNKNQKQQNQAPEPVIEEQIQPQAPIEVEVENPSNTAVQETEKRDNKKRRTRKNSRLEKKVEPVQTEEQKPVIETAETVLKPNEEIKPVIEVSTEEPKTATEEKAEVSTKETTEEKPKRTRRPNRGASKTRKPRAKKTDKEEKVEE